MEPPEEPHHPPANPSMFYTAPLTTAGNPSPRRSLRSASGKKPERANSLLDEFATEELRTLSKLLPASPAPAVGRKQPQDERSTSPGSLPAASTAGSQPTSSEHLSPESAPRTHNRAGSKRPSSTSNFMLAAAFVHTLERAHLTAHFKAACIYDSCACSCVHFQSLVCARI